MKKSPVSLWNRDALLLACREAVLRLDPRVLWRNPVILITEFGAILGTLALGRDWWTGRSPGFHLHLTLWLWLTVGFANFAEALAEGRGKAQARALREARQQAVARRLEGGREERLPAARLRPGDLVLCEAGDAIPADGEVVEGIASVDESAITGESAPVIRESGGDRSAVTGGTRVLSDRIVIRITRALGQTFLDRMIALVEGANRRKTPNEMALTLLLVGVSAVFALAVGTLPAFTRFSERAAGQPGAVDLGLPVLVALFICLIPTTIGGLLSAIGISGIDRLIRRNVLATSGRAVETAGDIDVLLLDKTGTITLGNRMAAEFLPAPDVSPDQLADAAQLASLADETPEGRSIVVLAKQRFHLRGRPVATPHAVFVPFTARSRMSGVDLAPPGCPPQRIRKGAAEAIRDHVLHLGGLWPAEVDQTVNAVARSGGTPLVVALNQRILGVIHLKDVVKGGIRERFAQLRAMGIRTVMVTGDNALTAAAIAAEAGVDDFLAQVTPEAKLNRIREEQAAGHLVAMTGDGTNDAPALAQADVGVAMNTGTQAAREAGNLIDLDSNPTKLIEIVEIGKQLLMTRGALTTFSMASDLAKYFAILPAMFGTLYAQAGEGAGPLAGLNVMRLGSPDSAILSAVIFNALIIPALVPLVLRGVAYRAAGAAEILRNNLLKYGLGGLVAPFLGIKAIDLVLNLFGLP